MNKIKWCFSINKGLKKTKPSKRIAFSYLDEAEKTLSRIKELIEENDLVWASVRIYYCAYYSLYSFLQRIGIKSENHECSIMLVKKLLKEKFIDRIDSFKDNRVDSQYYLKTGNKDKLLSLYKKVKEFYLNFKEIVTNIKEEDIDNYLNKIKDYL
ncbi:HEPN domain-containing protein [Candidatus Woesearchaeota archaeon]|nr:HEPN domain-containing protein [Candidatus Woesearchaeota archaeon]